MRAITVSFVLATVSCGPAVAAIDLAQAQSIFQQAQTICTRDAAALWGRTLCGPMLLVDPDDRTVVANQADAVGTLSPAGPVFTGVLPSSEQISDTTVEWSGTRWSELMWPWPMREDPDMRHVTLAHELFHRIQPDLHIERLDGDNGHLDTFDGRYLIELEWNALAAALRASTSSARRVAISDAILFRSERYRLFPGAANNEAALESNEGVAEYTGVRLGLFTPTDRIRYALRDLSAYIEAPSLVRSFAYATGPAYGLLLDQANPRWLIEFANNQLDQRFDQRLSAALHLPPPDFTRLQKAELLYDRGGTLRDKETVRDRQKRALLAEYQTRLVSGPVLQLPLADSSFQFKPASLVPLGDFGTVYPTMNLQDAWGTLTVEDGGVLISKNPKVATLSSVGFDPVTFRGHGFILTLKPGWTIESGARNGDLVVRQSRASVP
jgi:hypothetical protein